MKFWILAPCASQRTSFEEYGGADSWPGGNRESLGLGYPDPFLTYFRLMRRCHQKEDRVYLKISEACDLKDRNSFFSYKRKGIKSRENREGFCSLITPQKPGKNPRSSYPCLSNKQGLRNGKSYSTPKKG